MSAYRAICWCGWQGNVRENADVARADADEHVETTGHVQPDAVWERTKEK